MKIYFTRDPKPTSYDVERHGEKPEQYKIHFIKPSLETNDGDHYWFSELESPQLTPYPKDPFVLEYGECKEWVLSPASEIEKVRDSINMITNATDKLRWVYL